MVRTSSPLISIAAMVTLCIIAIMAWPLTAKATDVASSSSTSTREHVRTPQSRDQTPDIAEKLRQHGGAIQVTAGGESIRLEIPADYPTPGKATPVPHCSYKAKNQSLVATYSRAGVKGFGGSKAYLRCGSYGKHGWGLRHIGEHHKGDWTRKAAGSSWYDLMEFATKQTIKKPKSAIRQANDTYAYCAPVELKYNNKVYDKFYTVSPVSHGGKNIISSYPAKKCP